MAIPFRAFIFLVAILSGLITSLAVFADDIFDRLDGRGPSGHKVDLVEWEGKLEVHSYPSGSLKGLSVKLDDRTEGKKVMVIGYRFEKMAPLVRRAILGVPFNKDLKAFIDPTQKEFDKVVISNEVMTKPYIAYKLDVAPKQWYPDGDPRNEEESGPVNLAVTPPAVGTPEKKPPQPSRNPASNNKAAQPATPSSNENDGTITNFSW